MTDALELRATAELASIRPLSVAARAVLEAWGLAPGRLELLELALVEAATNVVRHAYRDTQAGPLVIALSRRAGRVRVEVKDRGRPFDPSAVPEPPVPDPADPSTWPEAGMGLPVIRSACDSLSYRSDGGENTLVLELALER